MKHTVWRKARAIVAVTGMLITATLPVAEAPATAYAAVDATTRAQIEECLYNAEYYAKANEHVAVALNGNEEALYQHWLDYGKAEGRNASMVFNAKYYLEVNPSVAAEVGNDYVAAYEHFVNEGLQAGLESSPVFSVKYYLEANSDVAAVFNGDYISAAKHFNQNAIAEGRSGSSNFDYTVYRACNTDVEELYGDYTEGYYIHYINHGRAEGRTGGLGGSGTSSGIDTTTPSYRIFDAEYYLDRYPSLETEVGTDPDTLYKYWLEEGIAQGQTASPVIVPEEYLELNQDVAEVFGRDYEAVLNHFLTSGILEGRTGSKEFDYSIYVDCNKDVTAEFGGENKVDYYFHYVKYGRAEKRTAAVFVPGAAPDEEPEYVTYSTFELGGDIESFGKSEGGVVIVQKDGLYGAVDYTGKEILPAEYEGYFTSPNKEGYFCLDNQETTAWVFDNQGNAVMNMDYTSEHDYGYSELYNLYISEGVVSVTHQDTEYTSDYFYAAADLENEKFINIDTSECDAIYTSGALTAMQDGKMYFSMDHSLYSVDRNGKIDVVYENPFADGVPGGRVIYRRAPRDGYGAARLTNDLEYGYRAGVISADGNDVCLFSIMDFFDMFEQEGLTWGHRYFNIDGQSYANIGKKIVIRFYEDEVAFTSFFIDLDRAEYEYHEVMAGSYSFGTEKLVSDVEDIIVAQYDDIVLSEDGIHYVNNDGTFFYIDDNGKVLATYKDCCAFYNGYAAVIDHNGDAYVINTEFERVSEIFEAELVNTLGEVHRFYDGTTNRMVVIDK